MAAITIDVNDRQAQVIDVVCKKLKCTTNDLICKLIDIHLDPLAVKHGLENIGEAGKMILGSEIHAKVPRGLHRLTRSQFEVLMDMYRQGWRSTDLALFYGLKADDIDTFFSGKTNGDIVRLIKEVRIILGREKQRWRPLGDH